MRQIPERFKNVKIDVCSDLLGSCRALCNQKKGIVSILGTGSNSCYFDGEKTYEEVPSLAYILGDEGSGSWFGKRLLQGFFYKQLPQHIHDDFIAEFGVAQSQVTYVNKRVYKDEDPNVYLASFTKFIGKHKEDPIIRNWLIDGFHAFLEVHVECFSNFREVPVGMLSSNPNALQWDDVFRTKMFWKQFGRDYQLELAHAYLEEDFRYNSNFVNSKLEAKNHFSSFEYQHHYKFLSTFFGINLQQRLVSSNYYSLLAEDELLVGYASIKFSKNIS